MKKHGELVLPSKGAVQFRLLNTSGDVTTVEMGIDYNKAEVPERAYYADYSDIVKGRFGYTFIFGKLIPGKPKLRTKIEIAFPEEMFIRQLLASSREFSKTVKKIAEKLKTEPIGEVEDTDKVQTFRSNNVFMGVWSDEAIMDFYYLSPKDMNMLTRNPQLQIEPEPIVRVAMGVGLIYEFLDKSAAIAGEAHVEHSENSL